MYNAELAIRDYMLAQGALLFWVDAHMNTIRRAVAANSYIPLSVVQQEATVHRNGYVQTYTATLLVSYPDRGTRGKVALAYSFNPERKQAHSVTAKAYGDPTV